MGRAPFPPLPTVSSARPLSGISAVTDDPGFGGGAETRTLIGGVKARLADFARPVGLAPRPGIEPGKTRVGSSSVPGTRGNVWRRAVYSKHTRDHPSVSLSRRTLTPVRFTLQCSGTSAGFEHWQGSLKEISAAVTRWRFGRTAGHSSLISPLERRDSGRA